MMIVMAFVNTAKMSVCRPACVALNLRGGVENVFVTYNITDVHRSRSKYRKREENKESGK